MTAEYGEDFYAQNKSGLLGSRDTQKFFHSALNAMDFEAQFTSGSSYWDQYVSFVVTFLIMNVDLKDSAIACSHCITFLVLSNIKRTGC